MSWYFCRKHPFLMLGTRCCQFCIWWQWYHYHRPTYYFFREHLPMVISQRYQKVVFTAKLYARVILISNSVCYYFLFLYCLYNNWETYDSKSLYSYFEPSSGNKVLLVLTICKTNNTGSQQRTYQLNLFNLSPVDLAANQVACFANQSA